MSRSKKSKLFRSKLTGKQIREEARKLLNEEEDISEKVVEKNIDADSPEFLWGRFEKAKASRVYVVSKMSNGDQGQEIKRLCRTLGMDCVEFSFLAPKHKIHNATYLGSGRLEQIKKRCQAENIDAVVMDLNLSSRQVRNLENYFKLPILERQVVILSIFKEHAKTKLAKMQVEVAQLKYLQTRLSGIWEGLSRQRGAAGGLGGRGLGEKRLELDRRVIKDRLSFLKKKLHQAEKAFSVQSKRRSQLKRVALVGYTNAGKSTLMNSLTKTNTLEEDKLFSTLDTLVRAFKVPTMPKILISDTVGFVRDLPHDLIVSFKSTLREAIESDLILHVMDFSDVDWKIQYETTENVLSELGANEIPRVFVVNKTDLSHSWVQLSKIELRALLSEKHPGADMVFVSAKTGNGIEELNNLIISNCQAERPDWSKKENDTI